MIRLIPTGDGFYSVEADEPVTVSVGPDGMAFVYRGIDLDELAEPVGAYDPTLPENTPWAVTA